MIAAVLLAAGGSRRLGQPKQLVTFRGKTLVRRAAEAAVDAGCEPVVVVLGAEAERVARELDGLAVDRVVNAAWEQGMAGSIGAGIRRLEEASAPPEAAVLLAVDQPLLTADLLRELCRAHDGSQTCRAACEYAGTLGIPALFGRAWFRDLTGLSGDRGARVLLQRPGEPVRRVPWPDGALDLDDIRSYQDLQGGEDVQP
jgi:molybdenum cofactor cytidylyltransferase